MKKKNGFTLVELLAVIVILAIILAIAIPAISNIFDGASKGTLESSAKMVLKAIEYRMLENDAFNPLLINENTVKTELNIDNSNYESLSIEKIDDDFHITIVGKNKWDKLTASGTKTEVIVIETTEVALVESANKPVLADGMTPIKWNAS